MSEHKPEQLDARLARLNCDAEPTHDLWPAIAAAITAHEPSADRPAFDAGRFNPRGRNSNGFTTGRAWLIAASVLLMVTSSALTYGLMRRSMQEAVLQARQSTVQQMQPVLAAMPASFGHQAQLGTEYSQARAALDVQFERHLRSLPPSERAQLERSLADLRGAANELATMLTEHPSDPLLQELLLSTYQNELGLLTRVNDLGASTSMGADL